MKKFLLGTTAVLAVMFFSASAMAASDQGVKLGLGGYYKAAFGLIADEDDDATQPQASGVNDRRQESLKQKVQIWFQGESTLDNGLTVGARVQMEGQTQTDQIDETWMYIKGSFGEIRVGDEDDARKLKAVMGPMASKIFATTDPDNTMLSFSNSPLIGLTGNNFTAANSNIGTNSTTFNVENDSTKIIYMTPSFNGFSLAASYAPSSTSDQQNNGGQTALKNTTAGTSAYSVAGSYDGKFDNVKVMASLGYSGTNNDVTGQDDAKAYQAGLALGFGNFMVGGSYGLLKDAIGNDRDVTSYEVGGTYNTGPYTVGLGWSRGEYEVNATREPQLDTYMISGAYALGPGITLDAAVQYNDFDNDGSTSIGSGLTATDDYKSTAVMVGSSIKF